MGFLEDHLDACMRDTQECMAETGLTYNEARNHMNKQAMDQMSGYLKAAEQSKAALEWLTKRRSDWVKEPSKNHMRVDHQGWGTGTTGYTEADRTLTQIMEEYEKRIVDDAIQLCNNQLKEAEHQIKYWAERL